MQHGIILFLIIFVTAAGFILNQMGYDSKYEFLNPVTFGVLETALLAAVGFANTPILKGSALLTFVGVFAFHISSLQIPYPVNIWAFSILLVPCFIGLGMEMLEAGKG